MEITLARALKYKNRLIGKISAVTSVITSKNSVIKGAEQEADIAEMLELRERLVTNLVTLKTAINKGNELILSDIFRLSELKSHIGVLQKINTTHGKSVADGGYFSRTTTEPIEYEAQLRFSDVETMFSSTNKKIDAIQEKIDQHNHSTNIDVELLEEVY